MSDDRVCHGVLGLDGHGEGAGDSGTYQLRLDFDSHLDGSGCGSVDARRSLGYHGSRRPPLTRMKRRPPI
jgi:hypothetical protein